MRRLERGSKLVVASHNKGKVWEINKLIQPYGLDAVSAGELDLAATLVKMVFFAMVFIALGLLLMLVPGATPK